LVTYEGDVHFYELRAETLERLSAIRERIYSAFRAVTDLDFYTCGYCGSRNLNEVYGRRVYRCGDCNEMVVDELMLRAKYRRLREASATASRPVAATV
jgi:DNA-directed RNA polymerase subunit RPC12/RpoP